MKEVLRKVIFIGLSIQIALGLFWMCRNFAGFQEFGESAFYVEISKNLICDEYTGVLYPVFLLLTQSMEKITGLPYYYVVYAVQLLTALFASHSILARLKKTGRWINLWGSLALLTIPMAMQCHMAVLPNSFTASCFLLELGACLGVIEAEKGYSGIFLYWLLCALLMPEYLYLGAVPVIFVFVCQGAGFFQNKTHLKECTRRLAAYGLFGIAVAMAIVGIHSVTQVPGCYGKVQKSPQAAMVSRFAWTSLAEYYEEWPGELKEAVNLGQTRESADYADNMARAFGPLVEEAFGAEKAKSYFVQLSRIAWERNKEGILRETAWDIFGYTLSPICVQMQFTGRGYDAYSGRNYEIMCYDTPTLSGIYMDYGCWWFATGLCVTAVLQFLGILSKESLPQRKHLISIMLTVLACGVMILWYTMRGGGMFDYKLTLAVGCLWCLWSVLIGADCFAENEERHREDENKRKCSPKAKTA